MKVKTFNVEEYCFPDRKFQFLFYQISHGEMIIRSQKGDSFKEYNNHTIDIYFGDVLYLEVPKYFSGISFRHPTDEDVLYLNTKTEKEITKDEIVVIESNGKVYYVVASVISVIESDLQRMELPIHCFLSGPDEKP